MVALAMGGSAQLRVDGNIHLPDRNPEDPHDSRRRATERGPTRFRNPIERLR
jgi:hypothetical protein